MTFVSGPIDAERVDTIRKHCAQWEAYGNYWAVDHDRDAYLYFYGRDVLDAAIPSEYHLVWNKEKFKVLVVKDRHTEEVNSVWRTRFLAQIEVYRDLHFQTVDTSSDAELVSIVSEGLQSFLSKFEREIIITFVAKWPERNFNLQQTEIRVEFLALKNRPRSLFLTELKLKPILVLILFAILIIFLKNFSVGR